MDSAWVLIWILLLTDCVTLSVFSFLGVPVSTKIRGYLDGTANFDWQCKNNRGNEEGDIVSSKPGTRFGLGM